MWEVNNNLFVFHISNAEAFRILIEAITIQTPLFSSSVPIFEHMRIEFKLKMMHDYISCVQSDD